MQIFRFGSKLSKNFDFGQYLLKSRFWSQSMKISILVKIVEKILIFGKSRFQSTSSIKSIWDNIFPKSWFWSKFPTNVDLGKNLEICRFWSKILKNLDLSKNFRKFRFWKFFSKNLKFGQHGRKILNFWTKLSKILYFGKKKIKNLDFGQN